MRFQCSKCPVAAQGRWLLVALVALRIMPVLEMGERCVGGRGWVSTLGCPLQRVGAGGDTAGTGFTGVYLDACSALARWPSNPRTSQASGNEWFDSGKPLSLEASPKSLQ